MNSVPTFRFPFDNSSLNANRASEIRFISRCIRRPKSLNIVEPPDRTIFSYNPRLTSIGHCWITASTVSDIDSVNSALAN